jgi:hypothetical protein
VIRHIIAIQDLGLKRASQWPGPETDFTGWGERCELNIVKRLAISHTLRLAHRVLVRNMHKEYWHL